MTVNVLDYGLEPEKTHRNELQFHDHRYTVYACNACNSTENALTRMMCPAVLQSLKAVRKIKAAVMVWQSPVPRRQINKNNQTGTALTV